MILWFCLQCLYLYLLEKVLILLRKAKFLNKKKDYTFQKNKTKQTVEALSHFTYTTCFKIILTFE